MREYYSTSNGCCPHFPKELGRGHHVGVCPLCLTDRLLLLSAQSKASSRFHNPRNISHTLGFLLRRLHKRRSAASPDYDHDNVDSPEEADSFISIKFGDNGVGLWEEKKTVSKVSLEQYSCSTKKKKNKEEVVDTSSCVVEHGKGSAPLLMWRKRIGHVFQLSRWRRSNNVGMCHVGREGVVKVGGRKSNGWIRNLMVKRRTMESKGGCIEKDI